MRYIQRMQSGQHSSQEEEDVYDSEDVRDIQRTDQQYNSPLCLLSAPPPAGPRPTV